MATAKTEKRLPVSEATRERLVSLRRGRETYDDVINALLDFAKDAGWRKES